MEQQGVKYYDGKSSLGFGAELKFETDLIIIDYTDKESELRNVVWEVANIHKVDFNSHNNTVLKYGEFPYQSLEITNAEISDQLFEFFKGSRFTKSNYKTLEKKPLKTLFIGTAALASLIALIYYFVLPGVAEQAAANLPYSFEEELGTSTVNHVLEFSDVDTLKTQNINLFFKELNYRPEHTVTVTVIKSDMVNAFAVPGGHIFVFSGIIDKMKTKEELAALLAHEYSHLKFRHSLKSVSRNLSSYLFLSAVMSDVNGIFAIIAQNADMLIDMDFSRSMEKEADTEGLKLMLNSRINPKGMLDLFKDLQDATPDVVDNDAFEMISTHPQTQERIRYISQEIRKVKYAPTANTKLDFYWDAIKQTK